MTLDPVLALVASWLMAAIFAAGAVDKLRMPAMFVAVVQAYGLLPPSLASVAAWCVALGEAALALALCVPIAWPWAQWGGIALMMVVTLAVAANLVRGHIGIDCGCGGASADQELSWALVWRNAVLVGMLLVPLAAGSGRPLGLVDYLVAGLAVVAGFGLYAGANQLLANAPRLRDLVDGHA